MKKLLLEFVALTPKLKGRVWFGLLLAIFTLYYCLITSWYYFPCPFSDGWENVRRFMAYDQGKISFVEYLFSPWGAHQTFLNFLMAYFDFSWFSGAFQLQRVFAWGATTLTAGLLLLILEHTLKPSVGTMLYYSLLAFIALIMFDPVANEVWFNGAQALLPIERALIAVVVWGCVVPTRKSYSVGLVALTAAVVSHGCGPFVFIMAMFLLLAQREWRYAICCAVIVGAFWLTLQYSFGSQSSHLSIVKDGRLFELNEIIEILNYLIWGLGGVIFPTSIIAPSIGGVAALLFIYVSYSLWKIRGEQPWVLAHLALMGFSIMYLLAAGALHRYSFLIGAGAWDPAEAMSLRFRILIGPFWTSLACGVAALLPPKRNVERSAALALSLACCSILVTACTSMKSWQLLNEVKIACVEMQSGIDLPGALTYLAQPVSTIEAPLLSYVREKGISFAAPPRGFLLNEKLPDLHSSLIRVLKPNFNTLVLNDSMNEPYGRASGTTLKNDIAPDSIIVVLDKERIVRGYGAFIDAPIFSPIQRLSLEVFPVDEYISRFGKPPGSIITSPRSLYEYYLKYGYSRGHRIRARAPNNELFWTAFWRVAPHEEERREVPDFLVVR